MFYSGFTSAPWQYAALPAWLEIMSVAYPSGLFFVHEQRRTR